MRATDVHWCSLAQVFQYVSMVLVPRFLNRTMIRSSGSSCAQSFEWHHAAHLLSHLRGRGHAGSNVLRA